MPFNEIVVDFAGRAWVDGPGSKPGEERLPGIVGVVDSDGQYRQVAGDVWFPNGMVVLDDGRTLYILANRWGAVADQACWRCCPGWAGPGCGLRIVLQIQ